MMSGVDTNKAMEATTTKKVTRRSTISIYFSEDNFLGRLQKRASDQGRSVSGHIRWLIERDLSESQTNKMTTL